MSPKIRQLAKENLARTSHFLHFEITHKIKVVKNSKFTSLRELCKVHLFLQILEEMSNSWYFMKIKICILCMCFQKFEWLVNILENTSRVGNFNWGEILNPKSANFNTFNLRSKIFCNFYPKIRQFWKVSTHENEK